MARPRRHQLGDIRHHHGAPDDPDPAVVGDGHRAVPALVHAAVAGLDVPRELLLAIALQPRIALEGRQLPSARGVKLVAPQVDRAGRRSRRRRVAERLDPLHQLRLVLAGDQPVDQSTDRRVVTDRGVETVEADRQPRPDRSNLLAGANRQSHRGVHRNGDADGLGPVDLVSIKLLDGEIDAPNPMPGGLQGGRRRGQVQRLMTKLVGGDQQDPHSARIAFASLHSDGSPITTSSRPWAVRSARSTCSGVSPRAKRKPR